MSHKFALVGAVVVILSAAGCTHTTRLATEASACQLDDLRKVYVAPTEWFGKTFCGEAYARLEWPEIMVLPSKDWKSQEDLTLALDNQSNDRLRELWGSRKEGRVRLQARLDGMQRCFEARTAEEECTPFRRPINLVAFNIERID